MPTTAPILLSTATNTLPDVCLRSSLLALTSVFLAASAADFQSCLFGFFVALLHHLFLSQSVFCAKEDIALALYLLMYLFLYSIPTHSAGCTSIFLFLSALQFSPHLFVDRTPTHTTCLSTYSSSAQFCSHAHLTHHPNTRGSRLCTPGLRIGVSEIVNHPSVMSHQLQHLSLSTSTRSFSHLPPLIFRPSPSLSCPLELDQYTLRDSRRSGGSTEISISHRL